MRDTIASEYSVIISLHFTIMECYKLFGVTLTQGVIANQVFQNNGNTVLVTEEIVTELSQEEYENYKQCLQNEIATNETLGQKAITMQSHLDNLP